MQSLLYYVLLIIFESTKVSSRQFINWTKTTKEYLDKHKDDSFAHCGGAHYVPTGGSKNKKYLYPPNYPLPYEKNSFCIWLIEVDANINNRGGCTITADLEGFFASKYKGECADYIEIRDGNKSAPSLISDGEAVCESHGQTHHVESTGLFLWIKFKSDMRDGEGNDSASWRIAVQTNSECGNDEPTLAEAQKNIELAPQCKSYQFVCTNKECISMAYRCDGYNDCGCISGCDEDHCGPLTMAGDQQLGISITLGIILFVMICLIGMMIEIKDAWMEALSEQKLERDARDARRRRVSRVVNDFTKGTEL